MAAIGASDVSISSAAKATKNDAGRRNQLLTVAFGDGAKTYPAGGIPLSGLSAAGFPNQILAIELVDDGSANGYLYKIDLANKKLRIYQGDNANAAAAPGVELTGSAAPAATSLTVSVTGY